ncbi:MAG: DUF3093 family protein [Kineosporiaceae bacterium]
MRYRERLWPAPSLWSAVAVAGVCLALVALPLGRTAGVVTGVVGAAALAAALLAWSPVLGVDDDALHLGPHHVPLESVAEVEVLDASAMRSRRGPALDTRTSTLLRPGIPGGIAVRAADGRSWLVSCRRPRQLAAATRKPSTAA